MQFRLLTSKIALALTTAIVILSSTTVTANDEEGAIDMAQLTCAEFKDLGRMEKMMSLVWLSGWEAQQQGDFTFTPDRGAMSQRQDAIEEACENNEQDFVMNRMVHRRGNN